MASSYHRIYCRKFLNLSNQTLRYKSKCIRLTVCCCSITLCVAFYVGSLFYDVVLNGLSSLRRFGGGCFTFTMLFLSCGCLCSVFLPRGAVA